jgi:hypothetical protein
LILLSCDGVGGKGARIPALWKLSAGMPPVPGHLKNRGIRKDIFSVKDLKQVL